MGRKVGILLAAGALVAFGACASRGRTLFLREGCGNCHRFREFGSGNAVDLTDVGYRRDSAWIAKQITDPAAHGATTRMPAFPQIKGFDLRSLVSFLRG